MLESEQKKTLQKHHQKINEVESRCIAIGVPLSTHILPLEAILIVHNSGLCSQVCRYSLSSMSLRDSISSMSSWSRYSYSMPWSLQLHCFKKSHYPQRLVKVELKSQEAGACAGPTSAGAGAALAATAAAREPPCLGCPSPPF